MARAAAGYALGRASAPSEADAARAREAARRSAIRDARELGEDGLERARERGLREGRRRGREAGEVEGRAAGQAKAAARGAGPTPLPLPKLPTDLTVPSGAMGFAVRPSRIIIGNYEVLERIAWQSWGGETATASAQLVGVDCDPSCAEGPQTRDSVRVTASNPSFNPDDVRHYDDLVVDGPDGRVKVDIPP